MNTHELQYEQFSKELEEKKEDEAVFQLPPDDEGWWTHAIQYNYR